MRYHKRVWFFLLGPIIFNFLAFALSWWLGYAVTGSYESAWEAAWVYRSLSWMIVLWVFFFLLVREFRLEGKSLKDAIGMSRDSIVVDVALGACILFISLLLWNLYAVPWEYVWPGFLAYFRELPLTTGYVTLVVASSFTAGLVEESIWRGYGFPNLEEKYASTKKAVAISSITWAVYHIDPFHIGIVFIFGILYGYLFVKVRRLSPLIIGHVAFDIIGFAFPQILTVLV